LVGHRAQHQRGDRGVHAGVGDGQRVGGAGDDLDRDRGAFGGSLGEVAQEGFGFDGEDLGDGGRVVGEVEPVASADLQDAPGQLGKQLASARAGLRFDGLAEAWVDARKDRMAACGGPWCAACGRHRCSRVAVWWVACQADSTS
jgi:hypothetical protein